MAKVESAGLLVFRRRPPGVEFLLAHPGGPFWRNRDLGAWGVPKGMIDPEEDPLAAAIREFTEETGARLDGGAFIALAPQRLKSGKLVHCWLIEAELDPSRFVSNSFEVEWPRGSGKLRLYPEIDAAAYMPPAMALRKIHPGQAGFIHEALMRQEPPPSGG